MLISEDAVWYSDAAERSFQSSNIFKGSSALLLWDLEILQFWGCGGRTLAGSFDFYTCVPLLLWWNVNRKSTHNLLSSV